MPVEQSAESHFMFSYMVTVVCSYELVQFLNPDLLPQTFRKPKCDLNIINVETFVLLH